MYKPITEVGISRNEFWHRACIIIGNEKEKGDVMDGALEMSKRFENRLLDTKSSIRRVGDVVEVTKDGCIYRRLGSHYESEIEGICYKMTASMYLHVLSQLMAKSLRKTFKDFGKKQLIQEELIS